MRKHIYIDVDGEVVKALAALKERGITPEEAVREELKKAAKKRSPKGRKFFSPRVGSSRGVHRNVR